jgi:hypothetical protein
MVRILLPPAGSLVRDELEGMLIAQLIASYSAAMECYRRAMLGEQTFEARRENLTQPQHLRESRPPSAPCHTSDFGWPAPAPSTPYAPDRSFSPPYEISYRGVKLPRISAALGPCYLRRGPICRRWAAIAQPSTA